MSRYDDATSVIWDDLPALLGAFGKAGRLKVSPSRSCANPKRPPGVEKLWHCGICPNCLLRRVALFNGGFSKVHDDEEFIWQVHGCERFVGNEP